MGTMSSLTDVVILTDNYDSRGGRPIDKITIHHMAGNLTAEQCGYVFHNREASANYGIDSDGRVGCYVYEEYRAWSTANYGNDSRAINIELADDGGAPDWHVSDTAIEKCIELCVDICRRYGIERLNYTGNTDGNLTRHNMFMATTCPGPYLESKYPYIADEVNRRLGGETPEAGTYKVNSEDGLWLLDEDGEKMEVYPNGTEVEVLGNGYYMYGYSYYKVRVLSDGSEGYMAKDFLTKVEEPTPTPQPSGDFQVGDRVVVSGYATEDSNGGGERTADYTGNPNDPDDIRYITLIEPGAVRPYHISVGNTIGDGDRGWVSGDQIRKID